jgi:hypothetical protein
MNDPAAVLKGSPTYPPLFGALGSVALVVLIAPIVLNCVVVPAGFVPIDPHTSQSPAVKLIDVIFVATALVKATGDPTGTLDETYSPMLPELALLLVVDPFISTEPDDRVIVTESPRYVPASLYLDMIRSEPTLDPLSAALLANTYHRVLAFVENRSPRVVPLVELAA